MMSLISSIISGSIIGLVIGALIGAKTGGDITQSAMVGALVAAGFSFACCVIEHLWHPLRSKCSACGSTNLEPWDYKRDHCLDCGLGTNYYGSNIFDYEPNSNSESSPCSQAQAQPH